MGDELLNVQQVAAYLQVKESTIYNWAQQGRIPAHKEGRAWRFDPTEIEAWLTEHTQPAQGPEDETNASA